MNWKINQEVRGQIEDINQQIKPTYQDSILYLINHNNKMHYYFLFIILSSMLVIFICTEHLEQNNIPPWGSIKVSVSDSSYIYAKKCH